MDLKAEIAKTKKSLTAQPVRELSKRATWAAVQAATEATPPKLDDLAGVHARTGRLKRGWQDDSVTEPVLNGRTWETYLKNNVQYAAYVNDGHRMDRHFVPGLYINPYSGELEYDSQRRNDVGIMVGTKTQYVRGLFMAEAGEKAFEEYVDAFGGKALEEIIDK